MIKWRKSSHSGSEGGVDCVEVAGIAETALIRDSKDPEGPRLELTHSHLRDLLSNVKAGRYDDRF